MIRLVFVTFLFQISHALADSAAQLPDPLSLSQAMQVLDQSDYYTLVEVQSNIALAQSQLEQAESTLGFNAQLELKTAYVEPSNISFDQSNSENSATLRLTKPIYDFGGSDNQVQAAKLEQLGVQNNISYVTAYRKIEMAKQFLEVILSDLKYAWDNEALAIAYVRHDAVKDMHALTQVSDLELLGSENRYQNVLHTRNISEVEQRHSRARLAEVLNRPSELPSNLSPPIFDFNQYSLPDYPKLLDKVLLNNLQVKQAEQQQQAAEQRVMAEHQQLRPLLSAELKLYESSRIKSSDDMRASLNLSMPLYESSSVKSRISMARAALLKQRASLLKVKSKIRKQALSLWQQIDVLNKRRLQLQAAQELYELQLDKSRALYDMEVKTDLGTAMVAISEIRYTRAKNEYELALAWMQLRLLAGETDIMSATL